MRIKDREPARGFENRGVAKGQGMAKLGIKGVEWRGLGLLLELGFSLSSNHQKAVSLGVITQVCRL